MMLQGKAFMTFLAFVVPDILKEISAKVPSFLGFSDSPSKLAAEASKSLLSKKQLEEIDTKTLVTGFDKLQTEIVSLRENLIRAVDESVAQVKETIESVNYKKEIEDIGKAVEANTTQLSSLQEQLDNFINQQVKSKPVDTERLDKFMQDGLTIFTKLEDVTTIHMAANEITVALYNVKKETEKVENIFKDSKEILTKLENVTAATDDLKK